VGVIGVAFGGMAVEAAPDPAALLQGTLVPQLSAAHVPVRSLAAQYGRRGAFHELTSLTARFKLWLDAISNVPRRGWRRSTHTRLGSHPDCAPMRTQAALGLLGAVVMPHNLFLHSSLVMTRDVDRTSQARVRPRAPRSTRAPNSAF
jgi:hypothetical protein